MSCVAIDVCAAAQGRPNWALVRASGLVDFVVLKATEGNGYVDHNFDGSWTFADNWREANACFDVVWTYHFAQPDAGENDAVAEADHYVDAVRDACLKLGKDLHDFPFHVYCLDIEKQGQVAKGRQWGEWVLAFCQRVEERTGTIPVIYTGGPIFNASVEGADDDLIAKLARYPLWLAAYVLHPELYIPKAFKFLLLWQDTGDQAPQGKHVFSVPGIGDGKTTHVDHDQCELSLDELKETVQSLNLWRKTPVVPAEVPSLEQVLEDLQK